MFVFVQAINVDISSSFIKCQTKYLHITKCTSLFTVLVFLPMALEVEIWVFRWTIVLPSLSSSSPPYFWVQIWPFWIVGLGAMDDDPSSHSHVRLGVKRSAYSGAQALT